MINSTRYSYLILRISLAAVFLVSGIDNFINPENSLLINPPTFLGNIIGLIGMTSSQLVYLSGVLNVIAGVGFVTGVFIRFFALFSLVFLWLPMVATNGFREIVLSFALLGGLMAVLLWPQRADR